MIVLSNCFSKLQLMIVKRLDQSQAAHNEIKRCLDRLSLYYGQEIEFTIKNMEYND